MEIKDFVISRDVANGRLYFCPECGEEFFINTQSPLIPLSMACYDCEDCDLHIEHGGKCRRFEYNCPFDFYLLLDGFPVETAEITSLLNEIKCADKRIQEIVDKTHSYGIRALDNLHWAISHLDDDIASAEEWAEIDEEE